MAKTIVSSIAIWYNLRVECGEYRTDCRRYARKRKVAGGVPGNFRGVCPFLTGRLGYRTLFVAFLTQLAYALTMFILCSDVLDYSENNRFFEFFYQIRHETHGSV